MLKYYTCNGVVTVLSLNTKYRWTSLEDLSYGRGPYGRGPAGAGVWTWTMDIGHQQSDKALFWLALGLINENCAAG